ncbi:MAG TPA: ATP-binding protein [Burkholderiales bacterium]
MRPGRLFWKIFFAFWLTLVAAAVITGTLVSLERRARESAEPELALGPPQRFLTDLAAATLEHGGRGALRQWMRDAGMRGRPVALYAVDEAGRDLLGRPVPEAALARAREVAAERGTRGARGVRLAQAPGGESFVLFVPAAGHRPPRLPARIPAWLMLLIGGAASLAVSAILAWYLARPIRALQWAFGAAASGRLDARVGPRIGARRDEIADLGRDFDRMAAQLQALVGSQRRLLHDVSHELRSPLARLDAAIGLARQDPRKIDASLERIEREAARLDELVGEVLTLARLESPGRRPAFQPVDFAEIVAAIGEDARFEAEAAGRRVRLEVPEKMVLSGNPELLHRAVENVVRNAVKHTAEASEVSVLLRFADARAVLEVRDRGPGIPEAELARIFEPFYRVGDSGSKGFGLGLAIAQLAVQAHGGTIRAANAPGGGLRVEISLPLNSGSGS